MDIRTRQGLLNALVGKVGKRMDNLLIPLELLSCVSRTEFSDKKAYLRWQKRQVSLPQIVPEELEPISCSYQPYFLFCVLFLQLNMLEEGLINHPVVGFGEMGRKLNELRNIMRQIEESEVLLFKLYIHFFNFLHSFHFRSRSHYVYQCMYTRKTIYLFI